MAIARTHNAVYNISFIGKQQKSLRILVKSSHRIDPDGIIQIIRYGNLVPLLLRAAHNASWLIKQKNYLLLIFCNRNAVYTDCRIRGNFFPAFHQTTVCCHTAFFDQAIRLSSGTDSCITDIFIDSDFFVHFFII